MRRYIHVLWLAIRGRKLIPLERYDHAMKLAEHAARRENGWMQNYSARQEASRQMLVHIEHVKSVVDKAYAWIVDAMNKS